MIMQDNEKKPALRFKGFTDPWEQRKLGDLCVEFRSGEFISASDITETGEYPVFGGNGLRGFTDRFNHDGEYTLIGRQGALCGNVNFAVGKSYFTEHAIAVRADKKNQTRFLYYLFSTMDLGQYSGQSAQPGLAVGNLVELKSTLPDKQEQEKISGVLTALDTLITLHQRKHEKLVNIKKSMLDKMFPQNGVSVPEIRFKGFTDPWEQRKLTNLCEKFTDGDWIEAKDQSDSGVRLVQTGNVGVTEYLDKPNNKKWISFETFEQLHCEEVYPGDILISRLPEPAGRACIMPNLGTKMITAVDCTIVRPNAVTSTRFLLQYLSSQAYFDAVNTCLAGGTRQRISRGNLAQFNVPIPSSKIEQEKIGEILEKLDTLITLHQRKLEKLQNIKKSCLEKMFV